MPSKKIRRTTWVVLFFLFGGIPGFCAEPGTSQTSGESEVFSKNTSAVVVREHPKTGKPYVSITAEGPAPKDPFAGIPRRYRSRPDYRLLDPGVKSGQIPYEGPVSDRKKVYLLAAGLAGAGTVTGALGLAAASGGAATGGAAGGAGVYGAAGAGVLTGTFSTVALKSRPGPNDDAFTHHSQAILLEKPEPTAAETGEAGSGEKKLRAASPESGKLGQ